MTCGAGLVIDDMMFRYMKGHPMGDFQVLDSGARQEFASGMIRDTEEGKVNYTRVYDGPMLERWAAHLTRAEPKYPDIRPGVPNWTQAKSPEERERYRVSAARHFAQWMAGETDEDHAAAVLFNINGYEYVQARIVENETPYYAGPNYNDVADSDFDQEWEDEEPDLDLSAYGTPVTVTLKVDSGRYPTGGYVSSVKRQG